MSFYTSLRFYRPTRPPRVTGPLLARFIDALSATGLFERKGCNYLHIKFGRSIDMDDRSAMVREPVSDAPGLSTVRSIPWDLEHDHVTLEEAVRVLGNHDRPIYRASVS